MALERGRSPFDRLRRKFEESERRCSACGHVDTEGGWRVTASGSHVRYQFVCPVCDAVETRDLRLG